MIIDFEPANFLTDCLVLGSALVPFLLQTFECVGIGPALLMFLPNFVLQRQKPFHFPNQAVAGARLVDHS